MLKNRRAGFVVKLMLAIAGLGAVIATVYYFWPLLAPLGDEDYVRQMVDEAGVFGPVVFALVHALQVIIAPIPGQVIGLVGGYAFGPVWGTVYAVIGSTLGFAVVLLLARKLGRPFVERFVSPKILTRFDYLTKRAGSMTFFLIFLLPGLPDDLIGFIAGLTKLRLRILLLASAAGRLPGYAVLSMVGSGLASDNFGSVVAVAIGALLLGVVAFLRREFIREFIKNEHRIRWIKRQWSKNWSQILIWTAGLGLVGVLLYEAIIWLINR